MDKLELIERVPLTNQEKEVYRTLRTNIEFTGIENKILTITSCTPNEGKTTVSYHLASTFAENGKKTLYIDADLRKSVFTQRFEIEGNPRGLSHYLSGQASAVEVIYKTNKPWLFVIPVGTFPSSPTELLSKERMSRLLEEVKEVFDYVIIDTPPLGSVIDAAVVAKQSDASLLVLEADSTSQRFVKNVVAQLRTANQNFLGVVLNKVDIKHSSYYGRRFGGYYGKKYRAYGAYYGKEGHHAKQ